MENLNNVTIEYILHWIIYIFFSDITIDHTKHTLFERNNSFALSLIRS